MSGYAEEEKSSRGRCQGLLKIFRAPIHRAHRAVIFAIAQLSCLLLVSLSAAAHYLIHINGAIWGNTHENYCNIETNCLEGRGDGVVLERD